jgi:hypothetical protein
MHSNKIETPVIISWKGIKYGFMTFKKGRELNQDISR